MKRCPRYAQSGKSNEVFIIIKTAYIKKMKNLNELIEKDF